MKLMKALMALFFFTVTWKFDYVIDNPPMHQELLGTSYIVKSVARAKFNTKQEALDFAVALEDKLGRKAGIVIAHEA